MQKHQQWLDNRSYIQHLDCLKRIKSRKTHQNCDSLNHQKFPCTSPGKNRNQVKKFLKNNHISYEQNVQNNLTDRAYLQQKQLNKNYRINSQSQELQKLNNQKQKVNHKSIFQLHSNRSVKQNFNVSLKQQQLLWDNFLLGKRIIETTPVISKKKHDLQYKKHKQLLKSRINNYTSRNSNNPTDQKYQSNQFRIKKLQAHQQQIYQIEDEQRIDQKTLNRKGTNIFSLIIQDVNISKYKTGSNHFQNVMLTMKYGKPINQLQKTDNLLTKRQVQNTECIDFQSLPFHQFFFILKKKPYQQNFPIVIQLKNVKSLNILPIGTFSFQFNHIKQHLHQQAKLFSFGKLIGIVNFSVHCGKKQQFKCSNI